MLIAICRICVFTVHMHIQFIQNKAIITNAVQLHIYTSRACLDQLLTAIRSLTLLCDHSRSKTRLIT